MKQTLLISLCIVSLLIGYSQPGFSEKENKSTSTGIHWHTDFNKAQTLAKKENKPLFVFFTASWCPPCKSMYKKTFTNTSLKNMLQNFIVVKVDVDKQAELANRYKGNARKYGGHGIPASLVLTHSNKEVYRHHGFIDAQKLTQSLGAVKL